MLFPYKFHKTPLLAIKLDANGAVPTMKSPDPPNSLVQPEDIMWTLSRSTSPCTGPSNLKFSPDRATAGESLLHARNLLSRKREVSNTQFVLWLFKKCWQDHETYYGILGIVNSQAQRCIWKKNTYPQKAPLVLLKHCFKSRSFSEMWS